MYDFIHNSLALCFWDVPALLVGVTMIAVFIGHKHKQKKREHDFEDMLEKKIAEITGEDKPIKA